MAAAPTRTQGLATKQVAAGGGGRPTYISGLQGRAAFGTIAASDRSRPRSSLFCTLRWSRTGSVTCPPIPQAGVACWDSLQGMALTPHKSPTKAHQSYSQLTGIHRCLPQALHSLQQVNSMLQCILGHQSRSADPAAGPPDANRYTGYP